MKLAIAIFKYFPFGGLQRDFLQIAEEMHRRGHQITVYTMRWNGPRPDWMDIRILRTFGFTNHARAESFFHRLAGAVSRNPPDLLLGMCRGPGLDVYFAGDDCFLMRQEKKHGGNSVWNPRFRAFAAMEDAVLNPDSKTEILCIVPDQFRQFEEYYKTPQSRMHLLPPGISPEYFRPADAGARRKAFREQHDLPEDRLVLLCVGANLQLKGADRLIAAAGSLPEPLRKKITVLLVGTPVRNLKKMAESAPVEIRFEGTRSDIMEYYLGSDLMVHPAREEAAGNVIVEALASGLPVLCTEVCGFASFVRESGAGYVLPEPFSGEMLSMVLESYLVYPERLRILGDSAAEYAKTANLTGRAAAASDFMETLFHAKTCVE